MLWCGLLVEGSDNVDGVDQKGLCEIILALRPQ